MSCGCNQTPCGCSQASPSPTTCLGNCGCDPCMCGVFIDPCADVNPDHNCTTKCNLDKSDNIWFVADQKGYPCKCKLDQVTFAQVIEVLERYPFAARDLMRITDDPCLLLLARTVKLRVPIQEDNQQATDRLMKNSLPYYTVFKGNTGGDPGHG